MFGRKSVATVSGNDSRVEELEKQVAELKAQLDDSRTELEAVNNSTHLGIWKSIYD